MLIVVVPAVHGDVRRSFPEPRTQAAHSLSARDSVVRAVGGEPNAFFDFRPRKAAWPFLLKPPYKAIQESADAQGFEHSERVPRLRLSLSGQDRRLA